MAIWIRYKTARCQHCGCFGAKRQHQNTAYCDEDSNYLTLCKDCQQEADNYYDELWTDYYNGCL